jgi:hypothetical protein
MGKIDQAHRQFGEDSRNSERKKRGNRDGPGEECEENGFGLPAVGCAAAVKMSSDNVRQLGVQAPKMDDSEQYEESKRSAEGVSHSCNVRNARVSKRVRKSKILQGLACLRGY